MDSVILKGITRFFLALNAYYEFSNSRKFIIGFTDLIKQSFFLRPVYELLTTYPKKDYVKTSIVMTPVRAAAIMAKWAKVLFLSLASFNENSLNAKIFNRLCSFFGNTKYVFRLMIIAFISSLFAPQIGVRELALLALPAFAVFTYKNIALSFSLFVFTMAVVPNDMWSNAFILAAAVFYSAIFVLLYFYDKARLNTRYLSASLMLYIGFCVLSFFTGFGGMDSIRVASILFSAVILGIITTNIINTTEKLNTLVFWIFLSMILTSLYGLLQFTTGIAIRADFVDIMANIGLPGRLYSTMGNPNNFAKFLTMFLPLCIAYTFNMDGNLKRIGGAVCLGIIFVALALTFSRASYLVIAGSVVFYILLTKPRLVPLILLGGLLALPLLPDVILMRLSTIGTDSSSLYRILIWEGVGRTLSNYWASGIGIGPQAFVMIYRAYAHNMAGAAMHAHNVFLNVWIEVGIGGFIAIIAYNLSTFRIGMASFFNTQNQKLKNYQAAGVSALVGFIMFSLVEHVWFYPRTMLVYFILMGIIWAAGIPED